MVKKGFRSSWLPYPTNEQQIYWKKISFREGGKEGSAEGRGFLYGGGSYLTKKHSRSGRKEHLDKTFFSYSAFSGKKSPVHRI